MRRAISLVLPLVLLLGLAACNADPAPAMSTPETTQEPEVFVTTQIIKDGASDYVIVYDGTAETMALANDLRNILQTRFGAALEVVSASGVEESTHEIVIGNCRPIAEKTANKLTGEFDFMIKVEDNKLVLCANHALAYEYMGQYLKKEVFIEGEGAELTLDSEDNLLYSKSALTEYTYIDYVARETGSYSLAKLFDWKTYQNADTTLPYRIYVPFNYTPEKEYPLLVNLHGAGLRGDDNQRHLLFIDSLLQMPELPVDDAIIIFPQCPEGQKWVDTDWGVGSYRLDAVPESNELKAVMELVAQLRETYSVDAGRIYACGFSLGGYGTWNLLMNHPDVFCAGVAMCGAGDPSKAQTLKDIPIWAIHGTKDPTVPVQGSRDMAQALESAGAVDFHYTELPDNEHDVWTYTYNNFEIFQWLFSQEKA